MGLFLLVITIFWFLHALQRLLFWLYLWQIKEYRLDRMRAHFELASGKKLLFNVPTMAKFIFVISSSLFIFDIWRALFVPVSGLFYLVFGAWALWKFWLRQAKFPVFTKKASLIFGAHIFIFLGLIIWMFTFQPHFLLFTLLALDLLVPLTVASVIAAIKPVTSILKHRLFAKAKLKREKRQNLLVVGITGSFGKTSTKEFLAQILETKFKVLKTSVHNNTEIAIAQTLLNKLEDTHEIFIVEMGAYKKGEIKTVCDIVKPHIGILTGINEQHLSLFGSQENIIKAKYELIEALPPNGLAVFNGDNKFCAILYYKTNKPKLMYAVNSAEKDVMASNIKQTDGELYFDVSIKNEAIPCKVNLLGAHNVSNLLAAIAVAHKLGVTKKEIQRALEKITSLDNSMQLRRGINGLKIIDDSYSANSDGVNAALDALPQFSGKKVLVMPCLIELGKQAKEIHKQLAQKIAKTCTLAIITTPDYFKLMQNVAVENGMTEIDFVYMEDPIKILDKIKSTTKPGDVVLMESRVPPKLTKLLC